MGHEMGFLFDGKADQQGKDCKTTLAIKKLSWIGDFPLCCLVRWVFPCRGRSPASGHTTQEFQQEGPLPTLTGTLSVRSPHSVAQYQWPSISGPVLVALPLIVRNIAKQAKIRKEPWRFDQILVHLVSALKVVLFSESLAFDIAY
jgi:hypothetical protein